MGQLFVGALILWHLKYFNMKNTVNIKYYLNLDSKADLWSLGVMLYYMIFHTFPFNDKIRILENIKLQT